jgi:ABC-type antimicrobial peptide transport system permease subunit
MVLLENATLLFGGLAAGIVAAAVTLLPHLAAGGAAIPWSAIAIMLVVVLVVGLVVGLIAVRAMLKAPLLQALRGE